MATYQFLQGLPRETQHAFVASLSPRSRSDFSAYITSMENDLAQKKEAFTLRGDTRDLELVDEDCGSLSESDTDSDVDPDVELQELLAEEEALQKSIAQLDSLASFAADVSRSKEIGAEKPHLEDSDEDDSDAGSEVQTSRCSSPQMTLSALMDTLRDATPEERRLRIAQISQENFMELIGHLPTEEDSVDLDSAAEVSEDEDLEGAESLREVSTEGTSHPSQPSARLQVGADAPDRSPQDMAICLQEQREKRRNTQPLGRLQLEGSAAQDSNLLQRLPPRSRARSAAADLTSAWEKYLGRFTCGDQGPKLKDSGADGEAIGAWLGGAISHAMCGAQVLESMVRGHFCAAPAQREVSRTVELYGLDEAGGPGSCLGGCLGALCGGLAALSQGSSSELLHAGSIAGASPSWAVKHAAGVLAREGTFDAEVVNFEFRRQCLQAHPQRKFGGLFHFLQVHCDLEVLRQAVRLLTEGTAVSESGTAAKASRLAQKELGWGEDEAVKARESLSANELEVQNDQLSRYLLDLSWQKDALKAMLEHLQNHEAYAILGVAPEISDADLTKAYKAAAMRLHPDKGGNAEQFKAARAAYERILETRHNQSGTKEEETVEPQEKKKAEKVEKVEKNEKVEKPEKTEKVEKAEKAQPPEPVAQDEEAPAFEPGPSEPEPETTVPEVAEGTRTSTPREVERSNDLVSEVASSSDSSLSDVDSLDEDVSDCCGTEGPPLDPEAVVRAIPVESCSRQAEHALDGAEMCLKVARLAEEAACGTRTWQQLLRCGTHLLDSTHCVTRAASGVARCAVNVPSDLVPLLEKIKTAQGMTRPAVNATRELMRCTEIISERGLKAAELSNRLLQQSQALADTLQSVSKATELSNFACRTMASTYRGLAGLARDTADASAAAAVMVGDAQQHAQTLKGHLDKLKGKAKDEEEKENEKETKDGTEDKETADASDESNETPEDQAASNRRLLLKLNGEVLELQKEMRSLVLTNPSLMPEVDIKQKERVFCLVHDLLEEIKWTFNMLGLHGENGPASWDEAMKDTLNMLRAAADWDTFASPSLAGRILRVAALVDGNMLAKMLKEMLSFCLEGCQPGEHLKEESHFAETVKALCRHSSDV